MARVFGQRWVWKHHHQRDEKFHFYILLLGSHCNDCVWVRGQRRWFDRHHSIFEWQVWRSRHTRIQKRYKLHKLSTLPKWNKITILIITALTSSLWNRMNKRGPNFWDRMNKRGPNFWDRMNKRGPNFWDRMNKRGPNFWDRMNWIWSTLNNAGHLKPK